MLKWIVLSIAGYGAYKAYQAYAAPTRALLNPFTDALKRDIFETLAKNNIPPALGLAIIRQESNFDPFARLLEPDFFRRRVQINPTYEHAIKSWGWNSTNFGSYGLGQLLLSTAYDLGHRDSPESLYDIKTNLLYMSKLLNILIKRFAGEGAPLDEQAIRNIAAAYNSGKGEEQAPMVTVTHYIPRVLKFYGEFSKLIKGAQGLV